MIHLSPVGCFTISRGESMQKNREASGVNQRAITGPPKMSFLLEAISIPALIIKPRLILVAHLVWNVHDWNKTTNQQQQMLIQTSK